MESEADVLNAACQDGSAEAKPDSVLQQDVAEAKPDSVLQQDGAEAKPDEAEAPGNQLQSAQDSPADNSNPKETSGVREDISRRQGKTETKNDVFSRMAAFGQKAPPVKTKEAVKTTKTKTMKSKPKAKGSTHGHPPLQFRPDVPINSMARSRSQSPARSRSPCRTSAPSAPSDISRRIPAGFCRDFPGEAMKEKKQTKPVEFKEQVISGKNNRGKEIRSRMFMDGNYFVAENC